ncbi:MAG: YhcH/YjgK/YiaL family protein [Bacilli bacterium]|jgi:YhcH/YjgK/YiaL family protein|nr:YhcH/YjgK/YiaL family protein [Bacilli bacterium]
MLSGKIADYTEKDFASPELKRAFRFISEKGLEGLKELPLGKTLIEGENLFALRQSYLGKKKEEGKLEGHLRYYDIQIILSGKENFGYVDKEAEGLKVLVPYDESRDIAFYQGELEGSLLLKAGFFVLVGPEDLHMPGLKADEKPIEKVVLKVKIGR